MLLLAVLWANPNNNRSKHESPFPSTSNVLAQVAALPKDMGKKAPSLKEIYSRSTQDTTFVLPSSEEVVAFESLLNDSISGAFSPATFESKWNELGWNLIFPANENMVVIEELPTQRRGRGLYALRIEVVDPFMLQAPHRFYDTDTGVISRKLFEENAVQAGAWNTVSRKQYDMAHRRGSFFNAFTRCIVKNYPDIINFQIHGFAISKRKGDRAESPNTLAIISNATRSPDQMTKSFASQMKSLFGKDRVWLFPVETAELGATSNKQASVMQQRGNGKFLHIEMAKSFREDLMSSASDRGALYRAFRAAINKRGSLAKTDRKMEAN